MLHVMTVGATPSIASVSSGVNNEEARDLSRKAARRIWAIFLITFGVAAVMARPVTRAYYARVAPRHPVAEKGQIYPMNVGKARVFLTRAQRDSIEGSASLFYAAAAIVELSGWYGLYRSRRRD